MAIPNLNLTEADITHFAEFVLSEALPDHSKTLREIILENVNKEILSSLEFDDFNFSTSLQMFGGPSLGNLSGLDVGESQELPHRPSQTNKSNPFQLSHELIDSRFASSNSKVLRSVVSSSGIRQSTSLSHALSQLKFKDQIKEL